MRSAKKKSPGLIVAGRSKRRARKSRKSGAAADVKRRGIVGQREEIEDDRKTRESLLEYFWTMVANGTSKTDAAAWMGFPLRTIQEWMVMDRTEAPVLAPLGRPPRRGTAEHRNAVVATLNEYGPTVGVPFLKDKHPHMSKGELAEIKKRWMRIQVKRYKMPIKVLHWTRPGTVWAMDYTEPTAPVDGAFGQILVVQDLASSCPIESMPLPGKSGKMVAIILEDLFKKHGAPAVLKSDNDSTFLVPEVADLLERYKVLLLLSPPYSPWYNGSVELTNGVLKRLTAWGAMQEGRIDCWSCDDVRKARDTIGGFRRKSGLTRLQTFESRTPFTDFEREALRSSYETLKPIVMEELRKELESKKDKNITAREAALSAKADRIALERALCDNGLLFYRSRRVSPLFSAIFRAKNS